MHSAKDIPCTGWVLLVCSLSFVAGQNYNVVCYFTNWSQYRPGVGRFTPENINASLCTHLIYAFADLQSNGSITQKESSNYYNETQRLKEQNPSLKTLLAVGGWSAGVGAFQTVAQSTSLTQTFAQNAIAYLRQRGFDGLDLDWEYPAYSDRGGKPRDRQDFTNFAKAIYEAFQNETLRPGRDRLLLSAAVAAYPISYKGEILYERDKIADYLDLILLMTYDLEGVWDGVAGFNAPIHLVERSVNQYISGGTPASKLNLGLGLYGRTFRLSSQTNNQPGSAITTTGNTGPYTQERGFLAYYEICENIRRNGWTSVWWEPTKTPYAYFGVQYVGYDNVRSFTYKIKDIVFKYRLGGAMVWSLDLDDFGNICNFGSYPLLVAINQLLDGIEPNIPSTPLAPSTISPPTTKTNPGTFDYHSFCAENRNGYYRDRLDCGRFFACNNGIYFGLQNCFQGLVFNEDTGQCDYGSCDSAITTKTTTTTTTTSTTTTAKPTTKAPATPGPIIIPDFCIDKTEGLYVYEVDCHYVVFCTQGATDGIGVKCPLRTAFNGYFCDWEQNVSRCRKGVITGCPATGFATLPDTEDCSKFYTCWEGRRYNFNCPAGLYFNPTFKFCDYPYNVECL